MTYAYLGLTARSGLLDSLAKTLRTNVKDGVLVVGVAPGGPADKAGIHGGNPNQVVAINQEQVPTGGDIITAFDGKPVNQFSVLISMLSSYKPGNTVSVTLVRNGKTIDVKVTLGERQAQ